MAAWLAQLRSAGDVDAALRVTAHAVGISYGTQQSVIDEVDDDSLVLAVQAFDGALQARIVDGAADGEAAAPALGIMARDLCRADAGSRRDRNAPPAAAADRARDVALSALEQKLRARVAHLGPDSDSGHARAQWQRTVRPLVAALGNDLIHAAGPVAWSGRTQDNGNYASTSLADLWFRRALARALPLAGPCTSRVAARLAGGATMTMESFRDLSATSAGPARSP